VIPEPVAVDGLAVALTAAGVTAPLAPVVAVAEAVGVAATVVAVGLVL
jgi:hypothetical protein